MPKREKMSIEHRAKQFLPFTALNELEIAIENKNKEYYKKLESSSYKKKVKKLLSVIENLDINKIVQVSYDNPSKNIIIGKFEGFNPQDNTLTIGKKKLPIDSIVELREKN